MQQRKVSVKYSEENLVFVSLIRTYSIFGGVGAERGVGWGWALI